MNRIYLLFIVTLFFFLINCSEKNEILSPQPTLGELNAEILQNYIDEKRPLMATALVYDYENSVWVNDISNTSCNGFKIESPFFIVCDVYYNLEYLFKYENNGGSLQLYFKQ